MTSFATTAGTVTSTLNAALGTANAIHNLLGWAADPQPIRSAVNLNRPKSVLSRTRPLPPLTGGTDLLDFSDFDEFD
jgi:hypothetical protein